MTDTLPFAKYQGAGNDFVIVDARPGSALPSLAGQRDGGANWPELARRLCDRHFGIGADGLLVAAAPEVAGAVEQMRMFNPDGSESEMCGNGLRCFVRWLVERGEAAAGDLPVQTGAGVLVAHIQPDRTVAVDMGRPRLAPAEVPLSPEAAHSQPVAGPVLDLDLSTGLSSSLITHHSSLAATCVSMGNPHAVLFVADPDVVPLHELGPAIEHHAFFPQRTNVEVCQVVARDRLRVRVWERGAGLTLACGTGACAAMVSARLHGLVGEQVAVELPGGTLHAEWRGATVLLGGPVEHVFDGTWRPA